MGGYVDAAANMVSDVVHMITNPKETAKNMYLAYRTIREDPLGTAKALGRAVKDKVNAIITSDDPQYKLAGVGFSILSTVLVPGANAPKALKVIDTGADIVRAIDKGADLARLGGKAAETPNFRGGSTLEKGAEATRKAPMQKLLDTARGNALLVHKTLRL